jgi:hypothetical protein
MTTMNVLDAAGATVAVEKPLAPGRAADSASRPVALSNEDVAILGGLTETAPANDTASSGLNGRLQRVAQNLSSLIALIPGLGAGGGFKVDGSGTALPVSRLDTRPASGNITVVDSGSSTASGQNSVAIVTGSPTAGSVYTQAINGQSTARVEITGTWTGTLTFEGSADGGTTWVPQTARVTGTTFTQGSVTANGLFTIDVAGLTNLRVRATAAMTGTAVVQAAFSVAAGFVQVTNPLRLVDNSSGAQATIKPASTSPAFADPALVVTSMGPTSTARLPSSAATTNATNAKASAGRIYQASGKNNAAYDVFLVLYDAATNPPVPGTTTIRKKIQIPAGQAFVFDFPGGIFANGIGYAFTKLVADADATALASGDITAFNLDYA